MRYIVFICGGDQDGETVLETESLYKAMTYAGWLQSQLTDDGEACVAIDSDEGVVTDL